MFPCFRFQAQIIFQNLRRSTSTWSAASRVSLAYELHTLKHTGKQSDLTNKVPIIFLHGFLGSKRENRRVSRVLAQDLSRPAFTFDLRNHGDSGHHPKHDYMEMALDVEFFITSHGFKSATLIGHPMGAKAALTLALNSPDLISDVIAVDNGPIYLPLTEEFPRYIKALAIVDNAKVRSILEAEKILKDYEESQAIRLLLLSTLVKESNLPYLRVGLPLKILESAIGPLGDFPHKDKAVEPDKPTLFLRALRSHYIPEASFPVISSFFPLSQIVDIYCGHWIVQDQSEEFKELVVRFLHKC